MSEQMRAARVFLSLSDLSEQLGLEAPGHQIEGIVSAARDERPGLWVFVSGPGLPLSKIGTPLPSISFSQYAKYGARQRGETPEPSVTEDGYTPARQPVGDADPETWPKFPGEPLHAGGPR